MKRTLLLTLSALMLSFSAQAAVINIDDNNGQQGRFQFTFETAQPGDTIVMATGEYITPWTFSITQKGIVIKAAEGAKPVVKLTDAGGWASIQLETTVTFDGITFDGNGVTKYPIYCIGKEAGTYTFKNCEFRNWDKYAISDQSGGYHVDSVIIEDCIFHDGGAAVSFSSKGYNGQHACGYFEMSNTTIYNVTTTAHSNDTYFGIIHVSSNGEATGMQNKVVIDHITLYNYTMGDLGAITIRKSSDLSITNSIIATPTDNGDYAFYIYGGKVANTIYYNGKAKSGPTYTGCLTSDPLFVYPEGGNFNLRPGSSALSAATDGKNLGDTRWGKAELVAVTGVELTPDSLHIYTTDTVKIVARVLPETATNRNITWAIADPTLASLDKGTIIALKPGETTITVTAEDGGFTDTTKLVIEQKVYHPLVVAADTLYAAEDYTVPSYIQMLVAKEAARRDSTAANVAALQAKIEALQSHKAPYDVVVNINGDPRTNMAFAWFTNETMTEGQVQLVAKADATEADFAEAITIEATTEKTNPLPYAVDDSGILWKTKMDKDQAHTYTSHKAIATGLTPNTTYTYRVGIDGYWSEMGTFLTAPEKTNEFSFIYMSDSHIESQDYIDDANAAARAALKVAPDAKFCAFPGDFVENYCSSEWEWERLFEEALRPMTYQMPIVPTDGNHDVTYGTNFQYHFNTDKTFHDAAEAAINEELDATTYSFMYGDVLFLVFSLQDYWKGTHSYDNLTSVYLTNHVGEWFKEQVAAHPEAKLRVGLVHYNIFSGSSHQDDEMGPLLRATLLPVIKECEIDFVIQGHDHCYEVMGPVDADTRKPILADIADREQVSTSVSMSGYKGGTYTVDNGAMYFIGSTCGHKRYWPYSKEEMEEDFSAHKVENYFDLFTGMFAQPDKPSFSVFTVKDRTVTVESYTANPDGTSELFNTFVVQRTKKHTGESDPSTNVEQLQDMLNTNITTKVLHKGQVLIIREGVTYDLLGNVVK